MLPNRYSVPVALAGLRVAARIGTRDGEILHDGRVVARHERLHGRFASRPGSTTTSSS
jgi:hypothetical protein